MSSTARLSCPICGDPLDDAGGSARCPAGHSFDYARSGYLNLTASPAPARIGDTAAMVSARAEFLAAGHYRPVAEAVAAVAGPAAAGALAEIGSGTGYYLAAVAANRGREGAGGIEGAFGFDLSKAAAGHAARRYPAARFVVADVEAGIPLPGASVGLALSVFSPRPAPELGRVVRPGGDLVVACAGPRHLERLRAKLTLIGLRDNKLAELDRRLSPWFSRVHTETVEYAIELGPEDARRLVGMGPNAWHEVDLAGLGDGHADLVSVLVARYRRDRPAMSGRGAGAADELGRHEQGEGGEGELQGALGDVVGDGDADQDTER